MSKHKQPCQHWRALKRFTTGLTNRDVILKGECLWCVHFCIPYLNCNITGKYTHLWTKAHCSHFRGNFKKKINKNNEPY